MPKVVINDPTLRDGNHAVRHRLNRDQIVAYARAAEAARIPVVEVGHGNGIGASSLQVGEALLDDRTMLEAARTELSNSKLSVHVIPGFATIQRDLKPAIALGVDIFRIGSHCTEADITQRHIAYVREQGREVYGVLMMSHMASKDILLEEAHKMISYGAEAIVLMDSAGAYLPDDVDDKVGTLVRSLHIPIGFHAHNNLGMGVANSVAAVQAGASIIDGSARGFGAGAGNAQLEVVVAVFERLGIETGIDLYKCLDCGDLAERFLVEAVPTISSVSIVSGMAGVFSGFIKHVQRISKEYGLDPRDVFFELGRRKVVAGQEDLIIEVAFDLAQKSGVKHAASS
ncbi:4-hydroxy-2-oxovalerate aldolase [Azospirillum agricola]|uniref:4-hydroxy-2-oxovalerate aldolase n=1 Tax=Azospirillum agricola TaxID=1720247 RepID=UPI000A0EFEE6|nr:4-hydroxy-2-oxovalerate aldolase [Azospirillum agricola]SMH41295.1 4-hydroxy 2-oxovalerate aldolase [Azospirillum lipoferum]